MDHADAVVNGPTFVVDPLPVVSVAVRVVEPPVEGLALKVPVSGHRQNNGVSAFGADVGDDAVFHARLKGAVLGPRFVAAVAGIDMRAVVVADRLTPKVPERGRSEHVARHRGLGTLFVIIHSAAVFARPVCNVFAFGAGRFRSRYFDKHVVGAFRIRCGHFHVVDHHIKLIRAVIVPDREINERFACKVGQVARKLFIRVGGADIVGDLRHGIDVRRSARVQRDNVFVAGIPYPQINPCAVGSDQRERRRDRPVVGRQRAGAANP